ncbi:MAG: hypothetical protein IPQ07_43070 [Myxococcales bacterium]|nr:hypothetical protein [Myxococcales bacterium]
MRRWIAFVMVAGCGGETKQTQPPLPIPAPTPTSHPSDAIPPLAPPAAPAAPITKDCIPPDFGGAVETFTADDHRAVVCLRRLVVGGGRKDETRCVSIDLATGAHADLTSPPAPPAPPPARFTVTDTSKLVQVCAPPKACRRLALKPLPNLVDEPREGYHVDVSADGTRAIATVPLTEGPKKPVVIFDLATGKQVAKVTVGDGEYSCPGTARFLGNSVYVTASVCNDLKAKAWLFSKDGKLLGTVDAINAVNVEFSDPYALDGDRWAIAGRGGNGVAIVDVATGKVTSAIATTPQFPPASCPYCGPTDMTGPGSPLTRTPAGRLLEFSAGIAMFDAAISKVEKHIPLRLCSAPITPP